MYKQITIKNIKTFSKEQNLKIAPLTLLYGENKFTVKFPEYELGFQRIVFAGDTEPTITMSKYDYINNKFLDHYECSVVRSYIN